MQSPQEQRELRQLKIGVTSMKMLASFGSMGVVLLLHHKRIGERVMGGLGLIALLTVLGSVLVGTLVTESLTFAPIFVVLAAVMMGAAGYHWWQIQLRHRQGKWDSTSYYLGDSWLHQLYQQLPAPFNKLSAYDFGRIEGVFPLLLGLGLVQFDALAGGFLIFGGLALLIDAAIEHSLQYESILDEIDAGIEMKARQEAKEAILQGRSTMNIKTPASQAMMASWLSDEMKLYMVDNDLASPPSSWRSMVEDEAPASSNGFDPAAQGVAQAPPI